MAVQRVRETDLYEPVKRLLEARGYVVKAEVGAVDIVAWRDGEEPLVVELKIGFSLTLFHQAVERLKLTDLVYVAVPAGSGRADAKALRRNVQLCKCLGIGVMTVQTATAGVDVLADPVAARPRKANRPRQQLLREFARRTGDPNTGGQTRAGLMTSYRQDALRCLGVLREAGAAKAASVATAAGVSRARTIMADNHYGWFVRVERGIYGLSPDGMTAAETFAADLEQLAQGQGSAGGLVQP